ncbi:hypothetical protein R3P38DRAFT_3234310 [Favolaschia claudopus]|uniref:Uncharacterized protein n=1 Tax=Favolaschia claudopus TaxID=2862362 RepID=A0AAV9ZHF5_9AGAR
MVELSEIPERFPGSEVDTAFILDCSGDERAKKETKRGKPKSFDAFPKEEDQDSWGKGSNGSTSRDTKCAVLVDIPTCRSTHKCNGAYKCELFDPELLNGYERVNAEDLSLTRKIFDLQLSQNRVDSGFAARKCVSIRGCKKPGCRGHLVLRKLKAAPNADADDAFGHTYAIPSEVDESLYATYHNGSVVRPSIHEKHGDDTGLCAQLMHPRHGKQDECPHVHHRDGKIVIAGCTRILPLPALPELGFIRNSVETVPLFLPQATRIP